MQFGLEHLHFVAELGLKQLIYTNVVVLLQMLLLHKGLLH
jgi:hypothetical protein